MPDEPAIAVTRSGMIAAWLVHLFTASGVVFALLALVAIEQDNLHIALLWLVAALVVDAVDGSLARMAKVSERAPRIDGSALDLIIDYLNYVFIPAVFIWRAGLVPPSLAVPLCASILVSALYNFTRRDMKTSDNYFRGFPALWNVVAVYLFITRPGPEAGAILIFLLAAMTFAPIHVVHPFRVSDFRPWPALIATLWAASTAALLWPGWSDEVRSALLAASATTAILLLTIGLVRTFRGERSADFPDVNSKRTRVIP